METQQPVGEAQNSRKKEWYKKWWIITIIAVVILLAIGIMTNGNMNSSFKEGLNTGMQK